jgi:hypothetical protein
MINPAKHTTIRTCADGRVATLPDIFPFSDWKVLDYSLC